MENRDFFQNFGTIAPFKRTLPHVYVISRRDIIDFVQRYSTLSPKMTAMVLAKYFPHKSGKQKRKETKLNCATQEEAETHRESFSSAMITFLDINRSPDDRLAARERIMQYLCKSRFLKKEFSSQCHNFLMCPELSSALPGPAVESRKRSRTCLMGMQFSLLASLCHRSSCHDCDAGVRRLKSFVTLISLLLSIPVFLAYKLLSCVASCLLLMILKDDA